MRESAGETWRGDALCRPRLRRGSSLHVTADLAGEHEAFARDSPQCGAAAMLREPVAVMRRSIEEPDSGLIGGLHSRNGGSVIEVKIEIPQRGGAEPDDRNAKSAAAEGARRQGSLPHRGKFWGHDFVLLGHRVAPVCRRRCRLAT